MSKGLVIAGIVVVLALAVAGVALYFLYERPAQEEQTIQFHNISILVRDSETGRPLKANFTILSNGQEYSGQTDTGGFTLTRVPVNQSFEAFFSAGGYYTTKLVPEMDLSTPLPIRLEPSLARVGKLSVQTSDRLGRQNPLALELEADGVVRHLKACLRWSNNLISVSIPNATLTDKEERLASRVDKCYLLNASLVNGETHIVTLNYKEYLPVSSADEIRLTILRGDYGPDGQIHFSSLEDSKKPFVQDDLILRITPGGLS